MADRDRAGHKRLGLCEGGKRHRITRGPEKFSNNWRRGNSLGRVVTHPRVFDPPTDLETALDDLDSLLQSPSLTLLREGPRHSVFMQRLLRSGQAAGNLAHDAHIAALIVEHGVGELWTADRDFARFPGIRVRNPFNTQN
jgi:toxin-antitoxin system PIN domain toxin